LSAAGRVCVAIVTLIAVMPACLVASAATYVVRPDGSGDYTDIAAAVRHASSGDIIELADGTFGGDGNRDIEIAAEDITIRSQSGDPSACRISCGEQVGAFGQGCNTPVEEESWRMIKALYKD
jgi:hypothetical protein